MNSSEPNTGGSVTGTHAREDAPPSTRSMRVGLLANPMVTRWQERALNNITALDEVTIEHVVVDASIRDDSSQLKIGADAINEGRTVSTSDLKAFTNVARENGLKAFIYADRKLGWLLFDERAGMAQVQSTGIESIDCLSDATCHEVEPVPAGGAWNTLPEEVTEIISNECDVVVRFAFGLLKGPILDCTDHGVLSAHGSDIREYRGMGPKISFLRDEDEITVTLQQLTEDVDGGRIVDMASRELPEYPTLHDVLLAVYDLQAEVFARGIAKLQAPEFEPFEPDRLGTYYSHDRQEKDVVFVAWLLLKNNWRRIQQRIRA
jgi:hypothetical protein